MSIKSAKLTKEQFERVKVISSRHAWIKQFDRYDYFVELWKFLDNSDQEDLIEELIDRYHYVDENKQFYYEKKIVDKIEKDWGLRPSDTVITSTSETGEVDGGAWAMQQLKNKLSIRLEWSEYNLCSSIGVTAYRKIKSDMTVVLVDDFSGSGKTLVNKVKFIKRIISLKNLTNVKIKVVAFAIMEDAKDNVIKNSVPSVDFYSPLVMKKGISGHYVGKEALYRKQTMTSINNKLSDGYKTMRKSDYKFGFKKSESLFQRGSGNCPNNVFPVFWWPKTKENEYRSTLFVRVR